MVTAVVLIQAERDKIPKLQIRTIKELLEGKDFDFPVGFSLRSGGGKRMMREGEQRALELGS